MSKRFDVEVISCSMSNAIFINHWLRNELPPIVIQDDDLTIIQVSD